MPAFKTNCYLKLDLKKNGLPYESKRSINGTKHHKDN